MATEIPLFSPSPISKYVDLEEAIFDRDPSIIVIEDEPPSEDNGLHENSLISLDDFNQFDEVDDIQDTDSTLSPNSKRAHLEPEDVDAIYGDMTESQASFGEGSSSRRPVVIDSASEASNSSSKRRKTLPQKQKKRQEETKSEPDESSEEPSGQYEVEAIIGHKVYRSMVVKYEVKWAGYSSKDTTWEPASSIHEDCPKMCVAYWSKHEPRPINAPSSPSSAPQQKAPPRVKPVNNSPYAAKLAKHRITNADLYQKMRSEGFVIAYDDGYPNETTNWALEMRQIHLIQRVKGTDQILAYVSWVNRKKTVHAVQELHERCPDELINYYEARIEFED